MQWLQPWSFLFAAFLIPSILLLYLLKRKYTDRSVSSTLLWDRVLARVEASHPWQRLRRQLLLLLQLLTALLFVLSLARPSLPTDGVGAAHTVLLIDVSGSMYAQEGKETRLDRAKEKAYALIDSMGPEHTMTVVEMGAVPQVRAVQTGVKQELVQAIDQIEGRVGASDPQAALSLAHALATRSPDAQIVVIGDGVGYSALETYFPDRFIQVGKEAHNLAVASFSVDRSQGKGEALVRIDNRGNKEGQAVVTLLDAEEKILEAKSLTIPAQKSSIIRWKDLPDSPYYHIQMEAEGDRLPLDNEAWAIPSQPEQMEVLWVGPDNLFLEKALQLEKSLQVVRSDRLTGKHSSLLTVTENSKEKQPDKGSLLLIHPAPGNSVIKVGGTVPITEELKGNEQHPLLKNISLKDVHIAEARKVEVPSWAEVVLQAGEVPLILAGEHQGRPVVVFTFDLHQSDLPLKPAFPVLMHQTLSWLLPLKFEALGVGEPGEMLQIPLSTGAGKATIRTPSGEVVQIEGKGGYLHYLVPEEAGLYEMKEDAGGAPRYFVVPFPESQSEIKPQEVTISSGLNSDGAAEKGHHELWWWMALATLLMIALEWGVFSRGY